MLRNLFGSNGIHQQVTLKEVLELMCPQVSKLEDVNRISRSVLTVSG
jgi:hypothetical protein